MLGRDPALDSSERMLTFYLLTVVDIESHHLRRVFVNADPYTASLIIFLVALIAAAVAAAAADDDDDDDDDDDADVFCRLFLSF